MAAVNGRSSDDCLDLFPPRHSKMVANAWEPQHMLDDPAPPPLDTREAELAALAAQEKLGHDGKRQRVRARRTVDPFGGLERWKMFRTMATSQNDQLVIRQSPAFLINLLPPQAYSNYSYSYCTRYSHTSTNKIRCPVNVVKWTPDARRILTGSTSGEFTLWNGLTFNFETILQAHDSSVRAMEWSHSGQWLVSTDNNGVIKYFQANMNNLQVFQGHNESIRDISWAPNDLRFATGADDGTIKLWNFEMMKEEKTLTGHGWDVKCVKWHPTKGLIVSGSKDNLVKFWDPRSSQVLTTFPDTSIKRHGHKNTVQALAWSPNGNSVATASRDQLVKVFDIRMMKELVTLRGHKKEVCSLAWHPVHDDLLVSGGSEGSIIHWCMPDAAPKDVVEFAHESNVWGLAFHPLGHILVSAGNDHTTRFWSRGRPALKIANDRFHVGRDKAREMGQAEQEEQEDDDFLPGFSNNRNGAGSGGGGYGGVGGGGYQQGGGFRPPPPMFNNTASLGDGMTGSIPGFGGGPDAVPGFGGPPPNAGGGGYQRNYGQAPNGYGGGGQGIRRGSALPSQQDALDRYGGQGGGEGYGRGRGRGRGGGRGGGGGRGRPY
ncbi:BQ2448_2009 [Microbotryum intermedium]|uniref:Polyadenylation factor subunit 2 n=1 Tax=Microbotryum intermedium TaxID=269621 RepID=A0A238F8A4_9BASI|nr:BQ2448_2009 [Microbotryum intermedium]